MVIAMVMTAITTTIMTTGVRDCQVNKFLNVVRLLGIFIFRFFLFFPVG